MHPEFPLDERLIHLNHAGVAPWPQRTVEALQAFAEENMHWGSRHYVQWARREHELRELLRWLINANSPHDIALLKSTSEALSVVAYGIDWRAGENVVTAQQEFPSNRVVWESLQDRFGVETRLADLSGCEPPEDALFALVDEDTRLLAISSVQYATGLRMDLERIGEFCRERDILFCVDAIQSLGAVPFDVKSCGADFIAADGHKWMLGPEGIALFYCRPELRPTLRLNQYGWHMVEDHEDFDRMDWEAAHSARRFECGSPNTLGIYGLHASLSLIFDTGLDHISEMISRKISYLHENINEMGFESLTLQTPARRAGILTFRHPRLDSRALHHHLKEHDILCALRGGGVRFSPHFYTPDEDLERAIEALKEAVHRA